MGLQRKPKPAETEVLFQSHIKAGKHLTDLQKKRLSLISRRLRVGPPALWVLGTHHTRLWVLDSLLQKDCWTSACHNNCPR